MSSLKLAHIINIKRNNIIIRDNIGDIKKLLNIVWYSLFFKTIHKGKI